MGRIEYRVAKGETRKRNIKTAWKIFQAVNRYKQN